LGSLPHTDVVKGTALSLTATPEIPAWVQFPRLHPKEAMIVQFTEGMGGLREEGGRTFFDTKAPGFEEELLGFYEGYLAFQEGKDEALAAFALSSEYAAGFPEFLRQLHKHPTPLVAVKGQVTGPFTLGTNLIDQDRRLSYYDERLRDMVVKSVALKAAWQIRELTPFCQRVMIFIDEPGLLAFGSSTFTAISRQDVLGDLNQVASAIHAEGALAGVHCEANTDWSLLMEAELEILHFDAYDHFRVMTLYPEELAAFLERGGILGWGIVPTLDTDAAATETMESLEAKFEEQVAELERRGHEREVLLSQTLLAPSCGMGTLSEELAERALGLLKELSGRLRERRPWATAASLPRYLPGRGTG